MRALFVHTVRMLQTKVLLVIYLMIQLLVSYLKKKLNLLVVL